MQARSGKIIKNETEPLDARGDKEDYTFFTVEQGKKVTFQMRANKGKRKKEEEGESEKERAERKSFHSHSISSIRLR